MKVLVYHEGFYPSSGGTEAHVRTLCESLPCDFEIVSDLHDPSLGEEPPIPHTRITRIGPMNTATSFTPSVVNSRVLFPYRAVTDWLRYRRTARYLASADCELMHFHGTGVGTSLMRMAIRAPIERILEPPLPLANAEVPKILTIHGLVTKGNAALMEYQRRYLASFRNFICVDRHLVSQAQKCGAPLSASFDYIPNSVDLQRFSPSDGRVPGPLRVGFAGRLETTRGLAHLQTLARRLPTGVELDITFATSHRQWDRLGTYLEDPRIHVQTNLPQGQMPEFYRGIDVLFNPVEVPGISRATLEAMACGKPVIMLALGDRGPVEDGITGFLLDPSVQSVEDLVANLVGKEDILGEMGRAARVRVERDFGNDVVLPRVLTVYKRVIET